MRLLIAGGGTGGHIYPALAVARSLRERADGAEVRWLGGHRGLEAAIVPPAGIRLRRLWLRALRPRYRPVPVQRAEMLPTLAAADLVVGRAGSSTLAEVTALGRPMVVVPYPHAAGHQRANAEVLARAGAARFIEDEAFDARALFEAAALLDDPATHARMSAAARGLARPRAAEAVARLVLAVAERRALPTPDEIDRISREPAG
jgi:UDP-N-acetylglucosamine--N-acetylmuramyl-(pentapeptide) pyrophosphoryl-undecaprenol N-acetylglucosamine transferase